ncbi:tRNA lysidine(34) synthetase TilS [Vibrio bivalvicida]|uniref:tRNA(Ile)-lysidine synthase n=1 Tax=Vibrio bivalvicida TaxID=1276888 RepID=A0A177Y3J8_9VIBR|nr:tRNA lysidine(34) synthetase TilS [Vibrio bivalvicida]OAJ95442.1 tRNA(Ile)-lysidine synthase [Vibrio bivalvicida]
MNLESIFDNTLEQHYKTGNQIILGLSGGLDSRVMLELMAQYCQKRNIVCFAVHVHHGLSPNADHWAQQCQKWCQQLSVEFVLERVSVVTEARSLEESARDARYGALKKYLKPGDLLLTGQHADDQLETFFLALKRGSGPKGLSSMAQVMEFGCAKLLRPLLTVPRKEIEQYAGEKQIDWVEDESNQDQRFERNYIRHSVTPALVERWPHIRQSIQRAAELCSEQEYLLDELLIDKYQQCLQSDESLSIEKLEPLTPSIRSRIIRMWLEQGQLRMPSREQLALIWREVALAQHDANPQLQLPQAQIRRYLRGLYIVQDWQPLTLWQQELQIDSHCLLPDSLGTIAIVSSTHGSLSQKALGQSKLRITFNPEGLSAHPTERGHSRKLKKLFQEYGVPSWLRRRTPILMCGERVAAVGDLFIDRQFIGQDCELIWDKRKRFM